MKLRTPPTGHRTIVYSPVEYRLNKKFSPGPPGKAIDYINHLRELVEPELKAVIYVRKSRCDQNDSRADQEAFCRRVLKRFRIRVIAVFSEVESGWRFDSDDRERLEAAAAFALRHNAILVAESTSRFIRSRRYSKLNQHTTPTTLEYETLRELTLGVTLATIHHPDLPPAEERSMQTKRGKEAKGHPGGRPPQPGYKKRKRLRLQARVCELLAEGRSLGEIERTTGVPKSTIRDWRDK